MRGSYRFHKGLSLPEFLDKTEKSIVLAALGQAQNNITEAARKLGITRSALHGKMRKYKIAYTTKREIVK